MPKGDASRASVRGCSRHRRERELTRREREVTGGGGTTHRCTRNRAASDSTISDMDGFSAYDEVSADKEKPGRHFENVGATAKFQAVQKAAQEKRTQKARAR